MPGHSGHAPQQQQECHFGHMAVVEEFHQMYAPTGRPSIPPEKMIRSRALARSLFTQAVIHLVDSFPNLERFYRELVTRKGCGRARIALLRKIFSMMRRMLLSREVRGVSFGVSMRGGRRCTRLTPPFCKANAITFIVLPFLYRVRTA